MSRPDKAAGTAEKDKFDAAVKAYHQRMLDSFKQAFDKHKGAYGVPKKQLVIV